MGHMDPTFNLEKNKQTKQNKRYKNQKEFFTGRDDERQSGFLFLVLNIISSIPEFLTVGFRRVKHEKCSTQRGIRVRTKNTGFHREFR